MLKNERHLHSPEKASLVRTQFEAFVKQHPRVLSIAVLLTECSGENEPAIEPEGLIGIDTESLDDHDRAVLVAMLYLSSRQCQKQLATQACCGETKFNRLVAGIIRAMSGGAPWESGAAAGCARNLVDPKPN